MDEDAPTGSLEELVVEFERESDDFEYFSDVAVRIRSLGPIGTRWIRERIPNETDPRRLRSAILALTIPPIQQGWVYDTILGCLASPIPDVVLESIESLRVLQSDLAERVAGMYETLDPYGRGAALRMIAGRSTAIDTFLERALADQNPVVRESALDVIDDHCLTRFHRRAVLSLDDPNPNVRLAAEAAVESTGEVEIL